VRPPDHNSDARGQVPFDAAATPIRPPLPLPGRHPTRVAPPSTTSTTMTTSTSASKGYHLHVVLIGFYSSHSIHAITTLQLRGNVSSSDSTFDLFSSLTVCGAPAVTMGDVRVYLVGYIFCIIDCHICRDIFDRIDIMYYILLYVSRGALPLKTFILYIYRPRGTMQYNQQLYLIYSSYSHQSGMQPDGYIKVQGLELTTPWSIGSSDEQSFCKLSTLRASTMTLQASGNCIIEW
jgi:hypothetical protein